MARNEINPGKIEASKARFIYYHPNFLPPSLQGRRFLTRWYDIINGKDGGTERTGEKGRAEARKTVESLSYDKGDPMTKPGKRRNLYSTFDFRNCLHLFSAPIGLRRNENLRESSRHRSRSLKYAEPSHFTSLLYRGRKEMCKHFYRSCTAIIKKYCCRRSFLKLPSD